jgi:hypothetical protein
VYERCGTYLATCTVVDDDGGEGLDTIVVRVVDVLNRDFEGGFRDRGEGIVANHWEPYGDTRRRGRDQGGGSFLAEEFVVHGGQRAQRIAAEGGASVGLRQTIGANPGWDYQVAAWYQLPVAGAGSVARLGIDPAGGDDPAASGIVWCVGPPSDAWAQLAERVTASGAAVTIFLDLLAGESGGRLYFDDVELLAECCELVECAPSEPPRDERHCVDFRPEEPRELGPEADFDGFGFTSLDQRPLHIVSAGTPASGALHIPTKGLQVTLPFTCRRVIAEIGIYTRQPVSMIALDGSGQRVADASSSTNQGVEKLEVEADEIVWVVLSDGGNEAVLFELCAERTVAVGTNGPVKTHRRGRENARKGR